MHVLLRESVDFRRVSAYYGGIIHVDLIKYIIFNIKDIYSRIIFLILKIFTVE